MIWNLGTASAYFPIGDYTDRDFGITIHDASPDGTLNTKGAWWEIEDSTSATCHGFHLWSEVRTSNRLFLDLAVGAAGSEQIIAQDLYIPGMRGNRTTQLCMFIPIHIAAGQRVSGRLQSASSANIFTDIRLYGRTDQWGGGPMGSYLRGQGADLTTTTQTTITPNATSSTPGAWSEITSSTTDRLTMMWITLGTDGSSARNSACWVVDIGVGAAGSEQVIIDQIPFTISSTTDMFMPTTQGPFLVDIPVGSRIAARASSTFAGDVAADIQTIGLRV